MKTGQRRPDRASRQAFTLIELMVVVAIIAIMIGAVFQLVSTVGQYNKKAETVSRMQRIQNAISGFYAEYGYYPPVPRYTSPDPWQSGVEDDYGRPVDRNTEAGFKAACKMAAGCQSVAFEYPPPMGMDSFINQSFQKWGVMSPNSLFGGMNFKTLPADWDRAKLFKFGLLSFLLPRVEVIGFDGSQNQENDLEPKNGFFDSPQWTKNNPVSTVDKVRERLKAQQVIENRTVARWLPNLEGIVANGGTILGIDTHEPYTATGGDGGYRTSDVKDAKGKITDVISYEYQGQKYVLAYITLRDGWDQEFFYYSPPPYQSYTLWSAGPDRNTFPPWIPLTSLSGTDRKVAAEMTADDIVRFDK